MTQAFGVHLDTSGLDKLIEALSLPPPEVKVGILGASARDAGNLTNAQVGAWHEEGTPRTPRRSFLRMPLSLYWGIGLDRAGLLDADAFKQIILQGSLKSWALKAAIVGEGIVQEAFATGGFGQWDPSDMRRKKVHQTLVETQQLRDSITSEVTA